MDLRVYLRHLDYTLLVAVMGLAAYGMLIIYSATHADPALSSSYHYVKIQLAAAGLGSVLLLGIAFMDYRNLVKYKNYIYVAVLMMILLVYLLGAEVKGSTRWIDLGPFSVQPSELAKIGIVLVLAAYLAERPRGELEIQTTLSALALVAFPAFMVFMEPDFGSALVLVAVAVTMLFIYGVRLTHFIVMAAGVAVSLFMVIKVLPMAGIQLLEQYQIDRLLVFLHPDHDISGAGYNLLQSKIAIGSGMMTGKGLYHGTQAQLNFLPEHHTDFIFSVLGEELGFMGAAVLFVLFMVVIWRGLRIMMISETIFGSLMAGGIISMMLFQFFVNIGMTIGIMPITGITLPFISYGGSSMVCNLIAVGLLESIHVRSKLFGDRRYKRGQIAP